MMLALSDALPPRSGNMAWGVDRSITNTETLLSQSRHSVKLTSGILRLIAEAP